MARPTIHWSRDEIRRHSKETVSGCWEWQRGKTAYGYGAVRYDGRSTSAHRMSWLVCRGEIPAGQCVLHKCDNPPCVRPEHLFLGSTYDNNRDRAAKGRSAPLRGETNGMAKLTADGVRLIRAMFTYGFSQDEIGKLFRVPQGYVSHVVLRKVWAHVE